MSYIQCVKSITVFRENRAKEMSVFDSKISYCINKIAVEERSLNICVVVKTLFGSG